MINRKELQKWSIVLRITKSIKSGNFLQFGSLIILSKVWERLWSCQKCPNIEVWRRLGQERHTVKAKSCFYRQFQTKVGTLEKTEWEQKMLTTTSA